MNFSVNPSLVAVIPAFNEAETIAEVVQGLRAYGAVIVVDDGSVDGTANLAQSAGAFVVSHQLNRGYDAALETGLLAARDLGYEFAVTVDADGQHDLSLIKLFEGSLMGGASLVVGYRDVMQRWSERLFSIAGRAIWGLHDPLCGMKGYKLSLLREIKDFNTYKSVGTELAIRLIEFGVQPTQYPIKTKKRDGSSRFGSGMRANLQICKALWIGLTHHF